MGASWTKIKQDEYMKIEKFTKSIGIKKYWKVL